jgi:sugar phosphate isomerase/epimerase
MARIPIALQLYSIREDCAHDLAGTLAAVAKMGYEGVEFAGYYDHEAPALRKLLDDLGMKVVGAHVGLNTLTGPELERSVEFHRILGNRFLIVPGLPPERRNSRAAWLETARIMNDISDRLRPHGMRTGYHNHTVEFQPMEGELPWDTFFGNTKPEVVMQFDTGNAMHGGGEAPPFLRRYPGRATTVHLKEYAAKNDKALIGEGDIPWAEVFRLCETVGGTEWYIVEQESYAYAPLECVDRCLKNLKGMGK